MGGSSTGDNSNWAFLDDLSSPIANVFKGRAHFFSHNRLLVPAGNVYYYSFVTSSSKHTVIYVRGTSAGEGPVSVDLLFGASFTPGTVKSSTNLFFGRPSAGMVITTGATGVSGGVVSEVDYLFGSGNHTATAAGQGLPTIFPPNTTALLRITNGTAGNNPGIRLSLAFAELNISPIIYS